MRYGSVFGSGLFAGKVVLITGGGSGIGRCVAHELAALGAHAVLLGRKAEKLQAVMDEIMQDGGLARFHICDIRDEEVVIATVASVVAKHGRIDGLVNNAGGQYTTPLEAISAKGWQAVINTNLTGGFLMARECFLQSMNKTCGAIVNIVADIWGSMPGMGHSGAARSGMVSFTETAALEWAGRGVRVNAVASGYIASSGMDKYPPELAPILREMSNTVPLGRFGRESETRPALSSCSARPLHLSVAAHCESMAHGRRSAWVGLCVWPRKKFSSALPSNRLKAFTAPRHPRCFKSKHPCQRNEHVIN